jgi:hypothetical protein
MSCIKLELVPDEMRPEDYNDHQGLNCTLCAYHVPYRQSEHVMECIRPRPKEEKELGSHYFSGYSPCRHFQHRGKHDLDRILGL